MNKQEMFANMIRLVRRAPLANMDEAEQVAKILQEFAAYADEEIQREKYANK